MNKRGLILVISAPSGTGKTTVINALMKRVKTLKRAISTTTRPPRGHERNGRDYFFVTPNRFQHMARQGAFVEWAKVHGAYYGTSKAFLDDQLKRGYDVVLNIDVQGGRNIKKAYPEDGILVFLTPPTWEELKRRLKKRGDISAAEMRRRLGTARQEMKEKAAYHYEVVNDHIDLAAKRIAAILEVARYKVRN